jgi:hypothetical protein
MSYNCAGHQHAKSFPRSPARAAQRHRLQACDHSDELTKGLRFLIVDEIGTSARPAFERALHRFDYIIHVTGHERIIAAIDEGELS